MPYSFDSIASRLRNNFLLKLILVCNAILLTAALSTWWATHGNTLFRNSKWLAGKDTCKFLFQTYEFMSKPLSDSGILLSGNMGFQEILYTKPDSPFRRMVDLASQVHLDPGSYIWIELEKKGLQMIGLRISRNASFKNGFYVYDQEGNLQLYSPYDNSVPPEQKWMTVQVKSNGQQWQLFIDGLKMGSIAKTGLSDGTFGFRGSAPGRDVHVKDISMRFTDPQHPAQLWEEKEDFSSRSVRHRVLPWVLTIAVLLLFLRILRLEILSELLPVQSRYRYRLLDHISLLLFLAAAWLFLPASSSLALPLSILGAESINLICFARLYQPTPPVDQGPGLSKPLAYLTCLLIITGFAFFKHGGWIWESQNIAKKNLKNVHPGIFHIVPQQKDSPEVFENPHPLSVSVGRPYFVPHAYSTQLIKIHFTIPSETTFDVVFQQQGFRTLGDMDGEELPMQRRLLRLSTRQEVAWGLATDTGTRPAPFLEINGVLHESGANELEILASTRGITVSLNGEKTSFDHLPSLGTGETGLMVFENKVLVNTLTVGPAGTFAVSGKIISLPTMLILLLFCVLIWLFLRSGRRTEKWQVAFIVCLALYPLLVYVAGILFLPTSELLFLGKTRFAWLEILSASSLLSLFYLLIVYKHRTRWAPLYSNAIILGTLLFMLAFVWTYILPESHPLRIKFSRETIAPGDPGLKDIATKGPWYNESKFIGANTWVWKQKFGGEQVVTEKTPGKIRIFVLGGSQAWGSGAESSQETFSKLLEKRLSGDEGAVEVFNAGINGAGIITVAKSATALMTQFNPDLVILDIGTNDSAGLKMLADKAGTKNLRNYQLKIFKEFVLFCRKNNIDILLNLETSCGETNFKRDDLFYEGLAKIAGDHEVPVIDASATFREKEADHLVYWDIAHFTPYGHRLMAEILSGPVQKIISERTSR